MLPLLIALILAWLTIIWIIDPAGEFMINDDWCYLKSLEALGTDGRIIETGWGSGGPSLIIHLLWGGLFSQIFGFSLTSILTRQLGVFIPIGFVITCYLHPKGRNLGRTRTAILAFSVTLLPWLAYEYWLSSLGSTSILEFQGLRNILAYPADKGFPDYIFFLIKQLVVNALMYSAFLISPVLALQMDRQLLSKGFRCFFVMITGAFVIVEAGILSGLMDLPTGFNRNVITDFGIGPVLLKGTYILKIQRVTPISKPFFYLLVYWASLSLFMLVERIYSSLKAAHRCLSHTDSGPNGEPISFLSLFSLLSALVNLGIISLTGFHDRYSHTGLPPFHHLVDLRNASSHRFDSKALGHRPGPDFVFLHLVVLHYGHARFHEDKTRR
jgi:hypothetical protein